MKYLILNSVFMIEDEGFKRTMKILKNKIIYSNYINGKTKKIFH